MTTIQTFDRTLALRCKRACAEGARITVSYESSGGWNRLTGVVQSVRPLKTQRFKPAWEITIIEQELASEGAAHIKVFIQTSDIESEPAGRVPTR
jgi:hypothetical protein